MPWKSNDTPTLPPSDGGSAPFSEAHAWHQVGTGWQPLFASFKGMGFSVEWHDFFARTEFDWAASFHPDCVELCLNLRGRGYVEGRGHRVDFEMNTAGFYGRETEPLTGKRLAGQQHQFLTVEFSRQFLTTHLGEIETLLHPVVRSVTGNRSGTHGPGNASRLTMAQQQMVYTLRHPPVYSAAQPIWYQCKAIELASTFLLQPPEDSELFCTRQQRLAEERVEQVFFLLKQNLAEPPSLEELGRKVGCSHFYLSRIFSIHTGLTITQCLRQLRMDRAAELLRSREFNVTEVALEVGYASPSHFSQAFHETFGCCPGLYPLPVPGHQILLKTKSTSQRMATREASNLPLPDKRKLAIANDKPTGARRRANR